MENFYKDCVRNILDNTLGEMQKKEYEFIFNEIMGSIRKVNWMVQLANNRDDYFLRSTQVIAKIVYDELDKRGLV